MANYIFFDGVKNKDPFGLLPKKRKTTMITNKNLRELIIGKFSTHAFGNGKEFTKENLDKSVKFADELMDFLKEQGFLKK